MGYRSHYVMVDESDPDWVRFWAVFPRRESKQEARRAWAKLHPSPELVEAILSALSWQVPYHQWNGAKRAYCPLPATYLNQARWEDEMPQQLRPAMSEAAATVFATLGVKV